MLTVACIPAYDVENMISDVVTRSLQFVDKVIVCDDGSNDFTAQKAKDAGAIIIKHDKNLGKGAALRSLFSFVKKNDFDIIVTIDGDGQFLPEEIEKLIEPIRTNQFDVVIGNRFLGKHEMPFYRKAGNKMLDKFTKIAADLPFEDTQSGFRAYSKKAIDKINFNSNGFGVDSEILIDAVNKDLKITEKYVSVIYDTGERTSTKNPVSHSMGVIASIIELIAINHPLKYLGIPGFILMIVGIFFLVIVLIMFNESRYFSIPSTLLSIFSLVIGLMLLLMSVVLYSISNQSRRLH